MERFLSNCTPEQSRLIEQLFREEYVNMVRFATNILCDGMLGEEAAQEAFLIALKKPEKLCHSQNQVGWLYNTVKNVILHIERDRAILLKRNVSLCDLEEHLFSQEDVYSDVNDEIRHSEEWTLLSRFYIEGYSIEELAKMQNISKDACKSRLKRARLKIKNKLTKEF